MISFDIKVREIANGYIVHEPLSTPIGECSLQHYCRDIKEVVSKVTELTIKLLTKNK